MKTIEDLKKRREESYDKIVLRLDNRKYKCYVHLDAQDQEHSKELFHYLFHLVEENKLDAYVLLGEPLSKNGTHLTIKDNDQSVTYLNITKEMIDEIVASHIKKDIVLKEYTGE